MVSPSARGIPADLSGGVFRRETSVQAYKFGRREP